MFELDSLRARLHKYVHDTLDAGAAGAALADELIRVGSVFRKEAPKIMKRKEFTKRACSQREVVRRPLPFVSRLQQQTSDFRSYFPRGSECQRRELAALLERHARQVDGQRKRFG